MKHENKYLNVMAVLAAVALAGCPTYVEPEPDGGTGFPQPENTVVVNFTIDATGRPGFYNDGDLEWKGSLEMPDAGTRIIVQDSNWDGPFPKLYDDGPWTSGGHEPAGNVANDERFGTAVFFARPTESVTLEYGAQTSAGGWIWTGPNGTITITSTSSTVTAEGLTLTPEGTHDVRVTLNTNTLGPGHTYTAGTAIKVKGTFVDWAEEPAFDDGTHGDVTAGDRIFTYTLSSDDQRRLKLTSGTTAEFIWVIGTQEYKTSGGAGETTGVKAFTKGATDANFVERTVIVLTTNRNTAFAVP